MRMNPFNLNHETFQKLDADPADTIRTGCDTDSLWIVRIHTDGLSVASTESVYVSETGA